MLTYSPTPEAFTELWQTTYFCRYLLNTFVVAGVSTLVALVLGIPAAYALSRFPGWVSIALLLALVFRSLPRFTIVLPMCDISRSLGIHDTRFVLAMALVAINQPLTIWLLRNFFAAIPRELDEAAMLDGCRRHQIHVGCARRPSVCDEAEVRGAAGLPFRARGSLAADELRGGERPVRSVLVRGLRPGTVLPPAGRGGLP